MNEIARLLTDDAPAPLRQRKAGAVYHALKRAILLRELAAGQALLEQQIAAAMGCSQGTVREALLRLQEDGLVLRRGYRGTVVSHTSAPEAAEMVRIRLQIEQTAAARAAERCGEAELAGLEALVGRMEQAEGAGDSYALHELDHAFHRSLLETSGLVALQPILSRCLLHMHRYTVGNRAGLGEAAAERLPAAGQHRRLIEALAAGDPACAAEAVRRHIESVVASWSPELWAALGGGTAPAEDG
ncbi:transcriptional regulator, GntR family [Tistlia consotensis]|uniref:Transcriptional regulator, GntR family n=1 Tax=Tistlia consotensis USBA 355 TaxID=560819 RepID=A0A1Y6CG36_9PROT|nr:GntR family transcriptional regulator [Tistlia consotensis]SMF54404.1 transcriptional regulator, GntR family [Tistlia consotensis USBA 355]SNR86911.1 transcriptional regulator, GntR family [Tistlia consotensis]